MDAVEPELDNAKDDNSLPNNGANANSESVLFKAPQVKPLLPQKTLPPTKSDIAKPPAKCYKPPDWAQICPQGSNYFIEVIKNGTTLPDDTIYLDGVDHCIVGRQPGPLLNPNLSDGKISALLHPSISRAHAVFQYGCNSDSTPGWYLFDLDSTHGTFVNKHQIPSGRYIRLRVGYVIRFGSSTRLLILNGPENDMEEETKETFSELIERKKAKAAKLIQQKQNLSKLSGESSETGGDGVGACNWGLADDEEEEDNGANMLQRLAESGNCLNHEKNYIEDPKKALKAFLDREGVEPEYEFVEGKFGQQICRVELPLEEGTVYAEVPLTGRKKKEAIAACALEACRMLDRLGQFDANRESAEAVRRAREKAYWQENDYYSSDEDTFLDRTGQIEVRRRQRMKRLGVEVASLNEDEQQDSFTLLTKLEELGKEMVKVEDELNAAERALEAAGENASEMDELEAYMEAIKNGAPKRAERQALKRRLVAMRQEEVRLLRSLGIRNVPIRFSSTASSSAVSAAVRATLSSSDKAEKINSESGHPESKLNALKRHLPKLANPKKTVQRADKDDEAFVPEIDEDEEQEALESLRQTSIQSGEAKSADQAFEHERPDKQLSSSTKSTLESDIKRPRLEESADSRVHPTKNDCSPSKVVDPVDVTETALDKSPQQASPPCAEPTKILGPAPPPALALESDPSAVTESMGEYDENIDDPDFALWLPPPDQTGDGITELNKKYGY